MKKNGNKGSWNKRKIVCPNWSQSKPIIKWAPNRSIFDYQCAKGLAHKFDKTNGSHPNLHLGKSRTNPFAFGWMQGYQQNSCAHWFGIEDFKPHFMLLKPVQR